MQQSLFITIRYGIFITCINLPLIIISRNLPVQSTVISLDLMIIALISFSARRIAAIMAATAFLLYLAIYSAQIYRFKSLYNLVSSFQFASLIDIKNISNWVAIGLTCIALAWISLLLLHIQKFRINKLPLALITISLITIDGLNGSLSIGKAVDRPTILNVNIVGSAIYNAYTQFIHAQEDSALKPISPPPPSYSKLNDWVSTKHPPKVLIVIVESLGQPLRANIAESMSNPLNAPEIAKRWTVTKSIEMTRGATTDAEMRVLCGLAGHYSKINDLEAKQHCITTRSNKSVGYHGFSPLMFQRKTWWPIVGLSWGVLSENSEKGCNNGFLGICDSAVISSAIRSINHEALISYALTLDTHLPVIAKSSNLPILKTCNHQVESELACQHIANLADVLATIAKSLADVAMGEEPHILIVGDHPPPFADTRARAAFDNKFVPLYTLTPKNIAITLK